MEVFREMAFDLAFRFRHEPEAQPITGKSCECADRDGARIPERIQQAGPGPELAEALPAPGEMVTFLGCGLAQGRTGFR